LHTYSKDRSASLAGDRASADTVGGPVNGAGIQNSQAGQHRRGGERFRHGVVQRVAPELEGPEPRTKRSG
jgi:hypothetical protein